MDLEQLSVVPKQLICLKCPWSKQRVKISHFAIKSRDKKLNFKKPTQISIKIDRIWSFFSVYHKTNKTLPYQLKFWWKIPIFLFRRPWFSFWGYAFWEKFSIFCSFWLLKDKYIRLKKILLAWRKRDVVESSYIAQEFLPHCKKFSAMVAERYCF